MAAQGKPQVNPQDYVNAWIAGMTNPNAAAKYKRSIQKLQQAGVSPPQMAATEQAMNDYLTGCQNSMDKRRTSLNDPKATQRYYANTLGQGANNLSAGAQKQSAKDKAAQTANDWAPVWARASAAAAAVVGPKGQATALAKIAASMQVMMQGHG